MKTFYVDIVLVNERTTLQSCENDYEYCFNVFTKELLSVDTLIHSMLQTPHLLPASLVLQSVNITRKQIQF